MRDHAVRHMMCTLENVFSGYIDRRNTIETMSTCLVAYHICNPCLIVELVCEHQRVLVLKRHSSMNDAFTDIFKVPVEYYHSLYPSHGILVEGVAYTQKELLWKESNEYYLTMVNNHRIKSVALDTAVRRVFKRFYGIPSLSNVSFPPLLVRVLVRGFKPSGLATLPFEKEMVDQIECVLTSYLFKTPLLCSPPPISHYDLTHVNEHRRSAPPSPAKKRIYAVSNHIQKFQDPSDTSPPQNTVQPTKYGCSSRLETSRIEEVQPTTSTVIGTQTVPITRCIPSHCLTKDELSQLKCVGQFDAKFIVCHSPSKGVIYLFDQHASHERVLYETYWAALESLQSTVLASEPCRMTLNISPSQHRVLESHRKFFHSLNFKYTLREASICVTSLPVLFSRLLPIKSVMKTVNQIHEEGVFSSLRQLKVIQKRVASASCRHAIMFNDRLTIAQCRDLIHALSSCTSPFICAHGRPTVHPVFDMQHLDPLD